jgi:hypothetical protein
VRLRHLPFRIAPLRAFPADSVLPVAGSRLSAALGRGEVPPPMARRWPPGNILSVVGARAPLNVNGVVYATRCA